MAIKYKGKHFLNRDEQIAKNTEDIYKLKNRYPTTNYVIHLSNEDASKLHIKQLIEGVEEEFDFQGGKKPIAGINIVVTETEEGYKIDATTEPIGSVSFAGIAGSPNDNQLLKDALDDKPSLTSYGNEFKGWIRVNNNSGIQIRSTTDEQMVWMTFESIRYYPNKKETQRYFDYFFPESSGDLIVSGNIGQYAITFENLKNYAITLDETDQTIDGGHKTFTGRIKLIDINGYVTIQHGAIFYQDGEQHYSFFFPDKDGRLLVANDLINYQKKLVSGDNIKTINGLSILGSGDIQIGGGEPDKYIKEQRVSGNTLTWVNKDGTEQSFTPSGSGGITDVQVNGSSVVEEGVAKINIPEDAVVTYLMTLNPATGEVTIDSPNYYNAIMQYVADYHRYPTIFGRVTIQGTDQTIVVIVRSIKQTTGKLEMLGVFEEDGESEIDYSAIMVETSVDAQSAEYVSKELLTSISKRVTDVKVIDDTTAEFSKEDGTKVTFSPKFILTPQTILNLVEGSEYISVDMNPQGTKVRVGFDFTNIQSFIEFADGQEVVASWTSDAKPKIELNLKQEISNKINNSLQLPMVHTEETLVGVDVAGSQEQIKIGEGLTIENGTLKATGEIDVKTIFDICNPIGSIKIFEHAQDMSLLSRGTWELIPDDTFLASKGLVEGGDVSGSNDAVLVSHTHTEGSAGGHTHTTNSQNRDLTGDARNSNDNGLLNLDGVASGVFSKGYTTNWFLQGGNGQAYALHIDCNHSHGTDNQGSHTHTINSSGVDGTNKNMPKYLATYIYRRIA